jgi:hypothetical protein
MFSETLAIVVTITRDEFVERRNFGQRFDAGSLTHSFLSAAVRGMRLRAGVRVEPVVSVRCAPLSSGWRNTCRRAAAIPLHGTGFDGKTKKLLHAIRLIGIP